MDTGAWVGYSPWGHKQLDTADQLGAHAHWHGQQGALCLTEQAE